VCSVRGLHCAFPPPDPPVYSRPQLKPPCDICSYTTTTTTEDNTWTANEILQKQRLQEGNNAQALSSPDRRSWIFTLEKIRDSKTTSSTRSWAFTMKIVAQYSKSTTKNAVYLCYHPHFPRLPLQVAKRPDTQKEPVSHCPDCNHYPLRLYILRSQPPSLSPPMSISWKSE
jgi:hypothetical protein